MNAKLKITVIAILVLGVTISMGLYVKNAWPLNTAELLSMAVAWAIVIIGLAAVLNMWQSMKTGQPLKDEMTVKLAHKAGYYTWMITIYLALAVGWVIDDIPGMMPRHGATAVLLLSAMTYFIVLAVLKLRGHVE
ncbi:MAG: DUF2178 domain-containing protein [Candidatus Altiarchaeota archaeon]